MKSPAVIYAYENLKGSKKSHDRLTSQDRRSEVAKDRSIYQLIFLMAILLILAGAVFVLTATAAGTTLTVNTTDDASDENLGDGLCATANGECSFRAAIEEIIALGADVDPHQIHFDIPGAGPHVIAPTEELPRINVPVVIDGSTQPGASCPTAGQPADLRVVLDGNNLSGLFYATGLDLSSAGSGSHGSTIRGLVIGNFISGGITIYSDNNQIECNHIGIGVDGVSPMGNEYSGISIPSGQNTTVGGASSEAQRNVISGNDGYGVNDSGEGGTVIANNYIGTTADGLTPLGNESGVYLVGTSNNTVGGASPLTGNVISGNERYGVYLLGADNNQVLGNVIGAGSDGTTPVPNEWDGIFIYDVTNNNTIGGVAPGEGNRIAYNGDSGILVLGYNEFRYPENNALRGNQIFGNDDLGIDLGFDGVDANDPLDGDSGPNGHQNYPILTSAASSGHILGSLESQPNQSYEIDFYVSETCDDSGYGQGEIYLGSASAGTDGNGLATIDVTFGSGVLDPGQSVAATATDSSGNTSEFSACAFVDGVEPNAPQAWITDCLGATSPPPPPGGDQFVYLPMLNSGSAPTAAGPADSQVAASANTLPLVDGGIVTGVDGVSLGAVSGTFSTTLNISITHTTAPTQTILGDPLVHGAYYHIAADENVLMCDQEKGFVLGLPVPDGVPTDTLAIVTIAPGADEWSLLTGLYNDDSQLMLVPRAWLTTEGSTVVLVENEGFRSQPEPSAADQIWSGSLDLISSNQSTDEVSFDVICLSAIDPDCEDGKDILIEFLELLYVEFRDIGFDRGPWLPFKIRDISILDPNNGQPSVAIESDATIYEVQAFDNDTGSCGNQEAPLGFYYPFDRRAVFCFTPPSPLSSFEMRGIRHIYFAALQFGFDDIVANYIFPSPDIEWILESMASAAEISTPSQMESSPDYPWRPVDVPLLSVSANHEYRTQDFWVYTGRAEGSGLTLLREALESPNAGSLEGIYNFFGGLDVFQYSYWYWIKNQVMLEDGILLNDDDTGDPCTYQGNVEELYWNQLVSNDYLGLTNAPNTLESLTAHVIEILPADLRPAVIEVRDPKTGDPPDNLRYKVYVDGEAGCELVADGDRSFGEPEWGTVVAAGSRVFIVVANVNPDEDQKYQVQVESAPYTP